MLNELHIKNFMPFPELDIQGLKRVNLIAGKNNAGKTALLEALRILLSNGDDSVINSILKNRASYKLGREESYDILFHRSQPGNDKIKLNDLFFKRDLHPTTQDPIVSRVVEKKESRLSLRITPDYPKEAGVYVPFQANYETLVELWEAIALTPKEEAVLNILRESVAPEILRFDVGKEKVRVRLENVSQPVPLSTLGDGVQRILLIALSLANAHNKNLLIDEIELGLHYTVLEKLWEMIFRYSQEWNIQAFITTHSQDAIRAFYYVASNQSYTEDAAFIRLQKNRKGEMEAIVYDGRRLEESLELALEIR